MSDENYKIFGELSESSLIRYKGNLRSYNAKDIADLIFLYMLTLQIFKSEFHSAPFAINYAKNTMKTGGNFDEFRTNASDLYLLIHTLFGKDNSDTLTRLNDAEANDIFLNKSSINMPYLKRWLYNIMNDNPDERFDRRFLMQLENSLNIDRSDYKSIRRLVTEWQNITDQARSLAVTRLLLAFRARARRSELLPVLEKLAKIKNYEIKGAKNPEREGTTSGDLLKVLGLGSLALAGVTGYSIYKTAKNLHKKSEDSINNISKKKDK